MVSVLGQCWGQVPSEEQGDGAAAALAATGQEKEQQHLHCSPRNSSTAKPRLDSGKFLKKARLHTKSKSDTHLHEDRGGWKAGHLKPLSSFRPWFFHLQVSSKTRWGGGSTAVLTLSTTQHCSAVPAGQSPGSFPFQPHLPNLCTLHSNVWDSKNLLTWDCSCWGTNYRTSQQHCLCSSKPFIRDPVFSIHVAQQFINQQVEDHK